MNKIFPLLKSLAIKDATPGSIIRISRSNETIIGLVSSQRDKEETPSIVLLNVQQAKRPPVIFVDSWRISEPVLCYSDGAEFEINTDLVDPRGNEWWEDPGVMVSIADQLYIRAAYFDRSYGWPPLVNIQTGDVFSGQVQGNLWTFGGWALRVRDAENHRAIELCSFKISA